MAYNQLRDSASAQKRQLQDAVKVKELVYGQTQNTAVIFSDSIGKQNLVDGHYSARGWLTWMNALMGQPFTLVAVNGRTGGAWGATDGNGGLRSDQILARINEQVLAFKPDWCFTNPGINDINQGKTAVEAFTNIKKIYDICLDNDIKIVGSTITPSATGMDTDAKRAEFHKLNRMLKEYSRNNPGVVLIDMGSAYIQPSAVKALDDHTVDQTHPSSRGAYKMGKIAAETLKFHIYTQPTTLVYTNTDPDNLLVNGNFFGSAGTNPATSSGTGVTISTGSVAPDGIVVSAYGSGTTATISKAPKENFPGEDLVLKVDTAGTGTNFSVYKEIASGFNVGDTFYAQIAFKFSDDAVIGKQIEFGVQQRSGTSTIVTTNLGLFQESSSPDLAVKPVGIYNGVVVLRTPNFKVVDTVNRLRTFFNPQFSAGSVKLIGWELRKVL